jgi:hypothetical protein
MTSLQARVEELWATRDQVPADDAAATATVHEAIDLLTWSCTSG